MTEEAQQEQQVAGAAEPVTAEYFAEAVQVVRDYWTEAQRLPSSVQNLNAASLRESMEGIVAAEWARLSPIIAFNGTVDGGLLPAAQYAVDRIARRMTVLARAPWAIPDAVENFADGPGSPAWDVDAAYEVSHLVEIIPGVIGMFPEAARAAVLEAADHSKAADFAAAVEAASEEIRAATRERDLYESCKAYVRDHLFYSFEISATDHPSARAAYVAVVEAEWRRMLPIFAYGHDPLCDVLPRDVWEHVIHTRDALIEAARAGRNGGWKGFDWDNRIDRYVGMAKLLLRLAPAFPDVSRYEVEAATQPDLLDAFERAFENVAGDLDDAVHGEVPEQGSGATDAEVVPEQPAAEHEAQLRGITALRPLPPLLASPFALVEYVREALAVVDAVTMNAKVGEDVTIPGRLVGQVQEACYRAQLAAEISEVMRQHVADRLHVLGLILPAGKLPAVLVEQVGQILRAVDVSWSEIENAPLARAGR